MNRFIAFLAVVTTNNSCTIADLQALHPNLLSLFPPVVTTLAVGIKHTNNYSTWQVVGSIESKTVKYGHVFRGTQN
jgi:hypothetical protein